MSRPSQTQVGVTQLTTQTMMVGHLVMATMMMEGAVSVDEVEEEEALETLEQGLQVEGAAEAASTVAKRVTSPENVQISR